MSTDMSNRPAGPPRISINESVLFFITQCTQSKQSKMRASNMFLLKVLLLAFLIAYVNAYQQCVGSEFGCRIIGSTAYCWGRKSSAGLYQLPSENAGDDFAGDYSYEKARPILVSNVVDIWCGSASVFLKRSDGSVVFRGRNYDGVGAIGLPSSFGGTYIQDGWLQANKIPVENVTVKMLNASEQLTVSTLKVAASFSFQCTLFSSYKVKCHGLNGFSQLGRAGPNSPETATGNAIPYVQLDGKDLKVDPVVSEDKFGCGDAHCCAVAETPTPASYGLYCWGQGEALGLGVSTPMSLPTRVNLNLNTDNDYATYPACTSIRVLAVRYATTCIQCEDYKIRCWGYNAAWKIGVPEAAYGSSNTDYFGDEISEMGAGRIPIPIDIGLSFGASVIFGLGYRFTCAVGGLGLKCWGDHPMTTLAAPAGRYATTSLPDHYGMGTDLPLLLNASEVYNVFAGENVACYSDAMLQTKCWGNRRMTGGSDWYNAGQLGPGDNDNFAGDSYRLSEGTVTNDTLRDLKPVQFGASSVFGVSSGTVGIIALALTYFVTL